MLEDHPEVAALGRQTRDLLVLNEDAAAVRRLEAGDQAQRRGLAAARRPQQGEDLAFLHRQRETAEDGLGAEGLVEVVEEEEGHGLVRCIQPACPRDLTPDPSPEGEGRKKEL